MRNARARNCLTLNLLVSQETFRDVRAEARVRVCPKHVSLKRYWMTVMKRGARAAINSTLMISYLGVVFRRSAKTGQDVFLFLFNTIAQYIYKVYNNVS